MNILHIKEGLCYAIADEPLRPGYRGETYGGQCVAVLDGDYVLIRDSEKLLYEHASRVLCLWDTKFSPPTRPTQPDKPWWHIPARQLLEMFVFMGFGGIIFQALLLVGEIGRLIWDALK